jgi:hypothetical protein
MIAAMVHCGRGLVLEFAIGTKGEANRFNLCASEGSSVDPHPAVDGHVSILAGHAGAAHHGQGLFRGGFPNLEPSEGFWGDLRSSRGATQNGQGTDDGENSHVCSDGQKHVM